MTTVAPVERFASLAALPDSLSSDDETLLRRIMPEDAPAFAEIIGKDPNIKKYVTWASLVRESSDVVPALQSRSNDEMVGRYTIMHHGALIGYIGISPGEREDEYGLGYFINESARGKGYAKGAVVAMLGIAKEHLSPKSMYLQISPENEPSVAIASCLGFQPAETLWDEDLGMREQMFRLEIGK